MDGPGPKEVSRLKEAQSFVRINSTNSTSVDTSLINATMILRKDTITSQPLTGRAGAGAT